MKKWEYTHRRWNYTFDGVIEIDIKKLGDEGWKLAKVVSCDYSIIAFFEREKSM